jgi:hypothetical protein
MGKLILLDKKEETTNKTKMISLFLSFQTNVGLSHHEVANC